MKKTVIEYYEEFLQNLHFYKIEEESTSGNNFYRMNSKYGCGNVQVMNFYNQFLIIIASFIPSSDFEKVSEIEEEYFEISQFETDSSYFKVGGRKVKQVDKGICCYANTRKVAYAFCEANKPTCFTKVIITKKYFDSFLEERFGNAYETSKNALDFLGENPNSPELNFVFQQIKDCPAIGNTRKLYMEGKVIEILSLITTTIEIEKNRPHLSVKLDRKDKRNLNKVITFMKHNLSAYPSIEELSKMANMSCSRFQMAFRQVYGTSAYEYLKVMRMNYALLLLQDTDDKIYHIALKVGYKNAGHFSKIFKETFKMSPMEYRNIHHI